MAGRIEQREERKEQKIHNFCHGRKYNEWIEERMRRALEEYLREGLNQTHYLCREHGQFPGPHYNARSVAKLLAQAMLLVENYISQKILRKSLKKDVQHLAFQYAQQSNRAFLNSRARLGTTGSRMF